MEYLMGKKMDRVPYRKQGNGWRALQESRKWMECLREKKRI
jgi:hypothetical protein